MSNNNNSYHHRPQKQYKKVTNMDGAENVNSHCTCSVDKKTQTYPLKKHSWSRRLLSSLRRRSRPNISFNSSPREDGGEDDGCPVMEKVPKVVIKIIVLYLLAILNSWVVYKMCCSFLLKCCCWNCF